MVQVKKWVMTERSLNNVILILGLLILNYKNPEQ